MLSIFRLRLNDSIPFSIRLFGLPKRAATEQHQYDHLCADLGIHRSLTSQMRLPKKGMVEPLNSRSEDVLQSDRFHSGEGLEETILRSVTLYNQQLPRSALATRTPLQAMKGCHKLRPDLFKN